MPNVVKKFLKRKYETLMTAGQLTYALPELPSDLYAVECTINSAGPIKFTRSGVNITITHYLAGEISDTDELTVTYFV